MATRKYMPRVGDIVIVEMLDNPKKLESKLLGSDTGVLSIGNRYLVPRCDCEWYGRDVKRVIRFGTKNWYNVMYILRAHGGD